MFFVIYCLWFFGQNQLNRKNEEGMPTAIESHNPISVFLVNTFWYKNVCMVRVRSFFKPKTCFFSQWNFFILIIVWCTAISLGNSFLLHFVFLMNIFLILFQIKFRSWNQSKRNTWFTFCSHCFAAIYYLHCHRIYCR